MPGPVAYRETLSVQLEAAVCGYLMEAQLAQQDVQPPFSGDPRRPGLGRAQLVTLAVDTVFECKCLAGPRCGDAVVALARAHERRQPGGTDRSQRVVRAKTLGDALECHPHRGCYTPTP